MKAPARIAALTALAGLLLGLLAGFGLSLLRPAQFTSGSQLYVSMGPNVESNQSAQERIATYASLATSDVVLKPAAASLDVPVTDIRDRVDVSTSAGTVLLDVTTKGESAAEAKALNEAVTGELTGLFAQLENAGAGGAASMTVVNPASDGTQTGWGLSRWLLAGGLLGLLVGLALGWLLRRADRTVRTTADLAGVVDGDVIAIPPGTPERSAALLLASALDGDNPVVVTHDRGSSPLGRELANALASSGVRTAYLDLRFDDRSGTPGVAQVIAGERDLAEVATEENDITVIESGAASDAARLIATPECRQLLDRVVAAADQVVIDAPALTDPASVVGALRREAAAVAVVRLGSARADELVERLTPIDRAAGRLVTVSRDDPPRRHQR